MPTTVYHITHIKNLAEIVKAGGLLSCAAMTRRGGPANDIGYKHIKDRRSSKSVPVKPGGVVANYVPFYFAPKSPMLYTISKGNVSKDLNQFDIIYLVCSAESLHAKYDCCFTDGHACMDFTEYYTDLSELTHLDWEVLRAGYWADTDEDRDRKRRRQAEFLVYNFVRWADVDLVGVSSKEMKLAVASILQAAGGSYSPPIVTKREWYY